jgi:cytidylate kinase
MKWITVSRKMGTHGTEIAREVASALGWRCYDTKAIHRMADELGVLDSVVAIDEKAPSFVQRVVSPRPMVYLERLASVIYELARQGDAVFLGRGSHLLLRDFPCALHVRVTASPETCLRTVAAPGLSREAAARAIKRTDDERSAFVRFAYGVDWEDPTRYDLVLNMDKLTVPLAVHTIVHLVRSPAIADASADALRTLSLLALESRAEAALSEATAGRGFLGALAVSAVAPGQVRVSGQADSEELKADAEKTLRAVKGVESVENLIKVVPLYTGA